MKSKKNQRRYVESAAADDIDDMIKMLSTKQKSMQQSSSIRKSSAFSSIQTGDEQIRDTLRRSNDSDKKEKVESAKNPAVKDVGFSQLAQKSPAASDNDRRITQTVRRSRRFDQGLDESELGI